MPTLVEDLDTPAVVIEAGLGDWSTAWSTVQSGVAERTRVCTYDRAGMGFSESGPRYSGERAVGRDPSIV